MIKVSRAFVKANFGSMLALTLLVCAQSMVLMQYAYADWRKEMGVFRIGIATKDGEPLKAAALEGFRSEMNFALAMPVEIFQARNASSLIDAAASSRIDYAILSALGFVTLDLTCDCVLPIVAPTSADGATAIRSVLFVNADKVTSVQDLSGKRLAIGPESSLTGAILPFAQFSLNGVRLRDAEIELIDVDSVEQAVEALASGSVDGFFGWDQVIPNSNKVFTSSLSKKLEDYPKVNANSIWASEPIRFGPHIIHKSVPLEAANALKDILEGLNQSAPLVYQAISPDLFGGLLSVTAQDYISAYSVIRSIARDAASEQPEPNASIAQ